MCAARGEAPAPLFLVLPGLLLGLQVVFALQLVVGAAVPDGPVVHGIAAHTEPGRTWGLPEADGVGGSGTPTTDQAVMTSGLGGPGLDPWTRAMYMPRLDTGSVGYGQLMQLAQGEEVDKELRGYFRYWAGYTVLTRPVLALWELPGLRLVVGAVLVGTAWAAVRGVARRWSGWHVAAVAVPLVLGSNVVMLPSVSMSHALSWATALGGLWLLALAAPRGLRAVLLATAVGAATYQFVDLLTNPVLPWALSAALAAGFAWRRSGEVRELLRHGLAVGLVWPFAWAFTWVSRWVLAVLTLGPGTALQDIGGQVQARLDLGVSGVSSAFGAATARNVGYWWDTVAPAPVVVLLCVAAVSAFAIRALRGRTDRLVPFALLCAPILIVPVWYEVLSNHSQIHAPFTYRHVPLALSLVLLAVVTCWQGPRREPVPPAPCTTAPAPSTTAPGGLGSAAASARGAGSPGR